MKEIIGMILIMLWWCFLLIGTVYLVQVYDWSCWWFLLTIALLNVKQKDNKKSID